MFMKKLVATGIAVISVCSVAQAAPPSWQGTFIVTSVSQGCASSDNTLGEFGTILYRPQLNPGDPAEGISLFFTRSTETIIADSGSFRGYTSFSGVETGHGVYPNATKGIANLGVSPINLTTASDQVHIKGIINNFFNNQPVCNVEIDATLIPRI